MSDTAESARARLLEEVLRLIEKAERNQLRHTSGYHAGQLLAAYPQADEIVAAASLAKMPVELTRPA